MGWPKGKPRKGHINANGTAHAAKGVRLTMARSTRKVKPPIPVPTIAADAPPPEIHGYSGTAITQPCPICLFAYADGGYCPECGWNLPIVRLPWSLNPQSKENK